MLINKVKEQIKQILKVQYGIVNPDFDVLPTNNFNDGDFYTNVALKYSKQTGLLPMQLANDLSKELTSNKYDISVVKPGFINFSLSYRFLLDNISRFADLPKTSTPEEIIIEYMQPNTNKPLHIGHLRNAALGSSLSNILEGYGKTVRRATVNNDRGLHITKSMWGYLMLGTKEGLFNEGGSWEEALNLWFNDKKLWLEPKDMEDVRLRKPDHFIGKFYVLADKFAGTAKKVEMDWESMLHAWENETEPMHKKIVELWKFVNNYFYIGYYESAEGFEVKFDDGYVSYESEVYKPGKKLILNGLEKGLFTVIKGGAIEADLSKYGLPNKVLIRSNGTGIYMTFDVELTRQRKEHGAKHLIWVVGSDQNLYFRQLFAVSEILGIGKIEDFTHYSYGMVTLPEGKMSSRKGNVVYADDLLKTIEGEVKKVMLESKIGKDLDSSASSLVVKQVALGAVKWSMLRVDAIKNIVFNIEQTVSFNGFSGPYVQYTHARCYSVLQKAGVKNAEKLDITNLDFKDKDELAIVRRLFRFNVEVERAAKELAPHYICHYLYDLCQEYNSFYAKHKIIGSENENTRLAITGEVMTVIKTGLYLLGIKSPKSM